MSSSRTAVPPRELLTSLMYSLPVRRLKEILHNVIPDATLGPVEDLKSTQLSRLYSLTMSDDRKLVLSFAPSLTVRLLRHEATMLSSEATLLNFITSSDRQPSGEASSSRPTELNQAAINLSALAPKLLKHSSNNREMAYPYSIFEPTPGVALSTLSIYLSLPERRAIDKHIGSTARALASLTSPSGAFGSVNRVVPDSSAGPSRPATGSKLWSEAFHGLLEGILRDGEDMSVLLPYEVIRAHHRRLRHHLDSVLLPRVVVLDVGSDRNVMVERGSDESTSASESAGEIKMTGLRSWSQGVFGDPLLADCFDNPSEGFLEGWQEGGENIIEDEANAVVRILLYRCFRAVVTIVTEHYRPQADSSRRELEGRRKLTSALADLEKVHVSDDDAPKRERSSSADAESSKRLKLEK